MGKTNGKTNDGFIDQSDAGQARHQSGRAAGGQARHEAFLPEAMRQELAIHIRLARTTYEKAQTEMIEAIRKNPASAINWSAEGMVKAQAEHEVWLWLENGMAEADPRETLKKVLAEVQYRVRSFFGSSSTSIFSNAVERARAEAYIRQAEQPEGLAKHFGI